MTGGVTLHVRAAVVRGALEVAARLDEWRDVEQRLPQSVVHARRRPAHAWLPFDVIAALDDAVAAVGGEPLVEELHRRAADPTLRVPLFRPLCEGAFRFFGRTPSALLRWTPGALRMSLRGAGDVVYEERPSGCRLTMRDPHPQIVACASWRAGTRGSLLGIVESVGFAGTVRQRCDEGGLVHDIRWYARTPAPPE